MTHATITYLSCASIRYFVQQMPRDKMALLILILIFIEYDGLSQMIKCVHLRFSLACGSDELSQIKRDFLEIHSFLKPHCMLSCCS